MDSKQDEYKDLKILLKRWNPYVDTPGREEWMIRFYATLMSSLANFATGLKTVASKWAKGNRWTGQSDLAL